VNAAGSERTTSSGSRSLRRQYALVSALFAFLVLGIIFIFGHLISQSLSRRYLQDALLTGREETERFAEQLSSKRFKVQERHSELIGRTLQGLPQREVLESIQVTDLKGEVVFSMDLRSTEELPEAMVSHLELSGALSDQDMVETENSYEIAVPLGEVGTVVGRISKGRLAERVVALRRDLLVQTASVAGLTLLTLVAGFAFVWHLIQRTQRAETKRREAEEMAALGALAANLAHEIRNPLNSININLELLEEDITAGEASARESLTSTRHEVSRLARLVSEFLSYAKPSLPSLSIIEVSELLEDVAEFVRPESRRQGVHLRLQPEEIEAQVRGDANHLRQVLLNLILNGVQATAGLEAARRIVELEAEVDPQEVALIVRDRGDGIPPEEIEHVRRAFYTLRRGGTGLGLAIADRIITGHGGRLELVNLAGGGFEARVCLPRARGDGKIGP